MLKTARSTLIVELRLHRAEPRFAILQEENIHIKLAKIKEHMDSNKLSLNVPKTQFIIAKPKQNQTNNDPITIKTTNKTTKKTKK